MSVENTNVIDIVSIDEKDNAVLTITDHLEWDNKNEHLLILQDKINSYLGAIEGGELYTNYPDAKNKSIIIRVVALHSPNEEGKIFLERVKQIIEEGGYNFQFKLRPLED
ncbi:MAG: hypothetical protein KGM16_15170 [Bacteroidota bacterium]|nr:hypothetical protein [Bacteroidota bacterium]